MTTVDRFLEDGLAAHQTGDLNAARSAYRRAIELDSENAEALHLLGVLEAQEGSLDAGLSLLERAVAREPSEPVFKINLANAYAKRPDAKRAAETMREAVALAPGDAQLRFDLGAFEFAAGNYVHALEIFEGFARANPKDARIMRRFGEAAVYAGDADKALAAANRMQELAPLESDGYRLASSARALQKNWIEVAHLSEKWAAGFPQDVNAWKTLSNALYELGKRDEAKTAFDKVMRLEPDVPANKVIHNMLARYIKDADAASAHLEQSMMEATSSAEAAAALAVLGIHVGQFADAERMALRAIELDPKDIRGYIYFATLKDGAVSDDHLAALERADAAGEFPPEFGGRLAFSLGTIYESRGQRDRAFAAFKRGNDRKQAAAAAEGIAFDAAAEKKRTDEFIAFFKGAPTRRELPPGPAVPIFVVGMPRSGTTLVESLLAAHPEAFGAGELFTLHDVHLSVSQWAHETKATSLNEAPVELVRRWREKYFEGYPAIGAAKFVVDKQPANHQSAGLIPHLFPEARIVNMQRNPVETCFSIWRRDFPKAWTYAHRLEDLAARYAEYARLTTHWRATLGPSYAIVQYEDLVNDFEAGAKRIANHCGLAWDDRMLDFHAKKRVVLTFSATQVRKPVYKDSLEKSRPYAPYLAPLRDLLREGGVDLDTGLWPAA
jgi:tetratricopeptide (TPR) repeat protein